MPHKSKSAEALNCANGPCSDSKLAALPRCCLPNCVLLHVRVNMHDHSTRPRAHLVFSRVPKQQVLCTKEHPAHEQPKCTSETTHMLNNAPQVPSNALQWSSDSRALLLHCTYPTAIAVLRRQPLGSGHQPPEGLHTSACTRSGHCRAW